ncbi:MAG TPA: HEAT repeat domain-containing protein [Gemmatimonadales bacterium]|nr:HEAT repeat domain-containing protein [Gemmatimonadales bacterium]
MAGLSGLTGLSGLSGLSGLEGLSSLSSLAGLETTAVAFGDGDDGELVGDPPPAWADLDPVDSLYRAARQLLSSGRYADAATAFADLLKRYPRSKYTADAYYWQAFALYKTGDAGNYRSARTALDYYRTHFSRADNRGDADALYAQIQAALAKQGDPDAAKWIREHAQPSDTSKTTSRCSVSDDDDDPRIAALNALLQMDAESAMPILKQVLARRDSCSVQLRRKAVFIISQKRTAETEDILLSAARGDPDQEVREQAVFWLSQVGSEKAVTALDSILQSSTDEEIQKKALFALSQIRGDRAGQILRDFAEKSSASDDAREQAIFWLGQGHSAQNAAFLRGLYARITSDDLKEKVIFSLSQMRDPDNGRWLLDLAQNEQEPVEMRKKALFWAGQTGASLPDLAGIYDRTKNEEMREQLIFVYSQRHESEAVDKLIDIAKHDPNAELRKKAVFWLGQSHDPRARQALLDIINQ